MAKTRVVANNERLVASHFVVFIIGVLLALIFSNLYNIDRKGNDFVENDGLKSINTSGGIVSGHAPIIAVDRDGNGIMGEVDVEITEGNGRVLINTNPFLEPDAQLSANIATYVAENISGKDLSDKNVIFDFNISGTVVGGGSAGISMTLAVISAIEGKQLRDDVAFTGSILPDGNIGQVGGVVEKATAAAENDYTLLVVPSGQANIVYYEKQTKKKDLGRGIIVEKEYYTPKSLNLTKHFKEEYGMEVKEVKNVYEALSFVI